MNDGMKLGVLELLVEMYDRRGRCLTPGEVAQELSADTYDVTTALHELTRQHLACREEGGGYRPTVTTREFLDLDLDADTLVIIDPDPCEDDMNSTHR